MSSLANHPYALTPAERAYLLATGAMAGRITVPKQAKLPISLSQWAWIAEIPVNESRSPARPRDLSLESFRAAAYRAASVLGVEISIRKTGRHLTLTRLS